MSSSLLYTRILASSSASVAVRVLALPRWSPEVCPHPYCIPGPWPHLQPQLLSELLCFLPGSWPHLQPALPRWSPEVFPHPYCIPGSWPHLQPQLLSEFLLCLDGLLKCVLILIVYQDPGLIFSLSCCQSSCSASMVS